ncbi:hypothetical protein ZHAS_00006920 [Anopheles sinensis]|uniref:Uncharacterized protein n=1 Tax=Anopheles sinensis TaxID=74873 RepID=A0A084VN87_ANOSI|nr:hypothetical protein ZHAS_00006920 [Anopheles sinensis]
MVNGHHEAIAIIIIITLAISSILPAWFGTSSDQSTTHKLTRTACVCRLDVFSVRSDRSKYVIIGSQIDVSRRKRPSKDDDADNGSKANFSPMMPFPSWIGGDGGRKYRKENLSSRWTTDSEMLCGERATFGGQPENGFSMSTQALFDTDLGWVFCCAPCYCRFERKTIYRESLRWS